MVKKVDGDALDGRNIGRGWRVNDSVQEANRQLLFDGHIHEMLLWTREGRCRLVTVIIRCMDHTDDRFSVKPCLSTRLYTTKG